MGRFFLKMALFAINSSKLLRIGAGLDAADFYKYGNSHVGSLIHVKTAI